MGFHGGGRGFSSRDFTPVPKERRGETVRRIGGRILGVILNRRQFPIPDFLYRRL